MTIDTEGTAQHLDVALDHLLAARVSLGLAEAPEPPWPAIDQAFALDRRSKEVRRAVQRALDRIIEADDLEVRRAALLAAEEEMNRLVAIALEAGWQVGWTAGRTGR